jgi:hypothetical protein
MKRGVRGYARISGVLLAGIALTFLVLYFSSVLAVQTILTVGPSNNSNSSLLEDRQQILNIGINNTDFNQTGSVTGLTITLPSGLVYTTGTQNISTNFNNTFSNNR